MLKLGLVRDNKINQWTLQREECLTGRLDVTLFVGERNNYDVSQIRITKQLLTHREELVLASRSPRAAWARLRRAPFRRADFYYHSLRKHLRGFDLVHSADFLRSAYTLADLKEELGFRLVLSWWQNIPYWTVLDPRGGFYRDRVIPQADAFVPYTEAAAHALAMEGIPTKKIHVVRPGVDLKRFRPGPKDEVLLRLLHIPEDAFVVTFVGKLASHKGVYVLPYALKILADDGMTKVHVVLAGRGAQRGPLEKLVGLWGLADRFHFLDFLGYHDIHRVHSIADAFVLPSYPTLTWQEQFGFVLVESMASGKAVVASNSGAIGEVVGDAGLLFPAGDFDALAGLLRRLITDRALREDLGGKARARAEALFDPSRNADALYDVYQQVVRA